MKGAAGEFIAMTVNVSHYFKKPRYSDGKSYNGVCLVRYYVINNLRIGVSQSFKLGIEGVC